MTNKLKCWKGHKSSYWERPSMRKNIFRGKIGTDKIGITKAYSDKTEEYTNYAVVTMVSGGSVKAKDFESEEEAIKFAKSYMRKNDKC